MINQKICNKKILVIFLFLVSNGFNTSLAEGELTALMQSLATDKAVKVAYTEIRHLELMDQPWSGSGYLYSQLPDLMIKEQLQPHRVLMGVKAEQLFYFDVDSHMRHQSELSDDSPYSVNIILFKALMNADEQLLTNHYLIELSFNTERWVMKLKPKKSTDSATKIVVSGLLKKQVDTISIIQKDGESSEFILQHLPVTNETIELINLRYQELRGE